MQAMHGGQGARPEKVPMVQRQRVQERIIGSAWPELGPAFLEPAGRWIGLVGLGLPRQRSQGLQGTQRTPWRAKAGQVGLTKVA